MQIAQYKEALEKELAEITDSLKNIAQYDKKTGDWKPIPADAGDDADPNEAADANEESIERQGEVAALETRFRNITLALTKIADTNYGTCEICTKEIETNRLQANPAARTCIADREREGELSRA